MKKTILTFFIFALSFSMFAQRGYSRYWENYTHFWARDFDNWHDGFVNVRGGAGTHHDVITTLDNGTVVFRDFDRAIVNNWIPVKFHNFAYAYYIWERGFIHESRLFPIDIAFQQVFSGINDEKRAQLQRQVDEINAMTLRHDTLFYTPQWGNVLLEVLSFDEAGRLRKFFYDVAMGDASGWYNTIIAYYNEKGELIYIFYTESGNHFGTDERYWLHEGRIIDFLIEWSCDLCEPSYVVIWSDERINELRAKVGTPLTKTMVSLNIISLTDFLDAQTLLSIVKSEDYRGQGHRRIENYLGVGSDW